MRFLEKYKKMKKKKGKETSFSFALQSNGREAIWASSVP